jgi:hypothetical protein
MWWPTITSIAPPLAQRKPIVASRNASTLVDGLRPASVWIAMAASVGHATLQLSLAA